MFMVYFLVGSAILFCALLGYAKYKGKLGAKSAYVSSYSGGHYQARVAATYSKGNSRGSAGVSTVTIISASNSSCDGGGGDGGC